MAPTVSEPSTTSATTTRAPSRAKSSAATRPSPAADPVISAVLPARRPVTESELDRHRARAAHLTAGPRHLGTIDEPELGDALQPLLDGDAHLHAGQVGPGAAVDAHAERHVAVELAIDDDLVGPLERVRVAVGGGEAQQDAVAFVHRAAGDLGVGGGDAGHGHRRVRPQQLL